MDDEFVRERSASTRGKLSRTLAKRDQIADRLRPAHAELEPGVRDDLLDIALYWSDLQVQLANLSTTPQRSVRPWRR